MAESGSMTALREAIARVRKAIPGIRFYDEPGLTADLSLILRAAEEAEGLRRQVAPWKWGYEYLQSRMESIGREGWAHDCDDEIAARAAQGEKE